MNFEELFLTSAHWIDVRAPIEFNEGHVPGAVNLPLLTDSERHEIGITYKTKGQAVAIALGHQLVSGAIREVREQSWLRESQRYERSVFYCFRGGLRSKTVQAWMAEKGLDRPIVPGGYKALRRFFLEILQSRTLHLNLQVVAGPTGSGKTEFITSSGRPYIDLEGLAAHRGSAFGAIGIAQPSQADFENALAVKILQLAEQREPVLIENESRLIGIRTIPEILFQKIRTSPKIELKRTLEERVENIFRDYILHSSLGRENDVRKFSEFRQATMAISRRLGGTRTREVLDDLNFAQKRFEECRSLDENRGWIRKLLIWYYDPRYRGEGPEPI